MYLKVFFGVSGDQDVFTRADDHITTTLQGAAVQQHVAAVLQGDTAVFFIQCGVHSDVATGNYRTADIFGVQCFVKAGFTTPKRFFLFFVFVVVFRVVHCDQIGIAFGVQGSVALRRERAADHVDVLPGFEACIGTGSNGGLNVGDGTVNAVVAFAVGFAVAAVGYRFEVEIAFGVERNITLRGNVGAK